ncbi:MAG: hypothetical protein H6738_07560 [Alphaproteobacteria bacterium]|nr:hypothetical protein [Alphaproteobacteria bacterium]MCB9696621.1 hypothetical protein [Alphaproteobacteria bacterium]
MTTKLNQIVAIEKGVKSRVYSAVTELHKESQKAEPYTGLSKTYRKRDEDGEDMPGETKRVRQVATDVLAQLSKLQTELWDVEATREWANTKARADVVVDGRVLVKDAPVTYLLFLEKQVNDLRTFVDKMPTLDDTEEWSEDPNTGLFRTDRVTTHRTKKTPKVIVKYDATKEHPAQTELVHEDLVVGYWETVKSSGALPAPRKAKLLERIEKLGRAVKIAREQANDLACEKLEVGATVFGWLLD